ncbi:hypothetical protein [Legionella quateirensis]|uniref:Uncharacterized protein n=1 Tax=Legionella quateirensis TaxID=45072 RepID=A0A378KR72_9GAMM|nr:hypothetical protein [Legionella quateirensis]KTD42462.1 hypothetical protein Lqua_3440 [Legionella quateirensis]STY17083.1 Uncharacterised protein [Legionella quateirensis]
MFVIKHLMVQILLLVSMLSYADDLTNPYMIPVKINMQDCINENMDDCLKSICLASPASCRAQCTMNSADKCKKMAGQTIYQD